MRAGDYSISHVMRTNLEAIIGKSQTHVIFRAPNNCPHPIEKTDEDTGLVSQNSARSRCPFRPLSAKPRELPWQTIPVSVWNFDQLNLSLKADKRERISKGRSTSNPIRPHRQLSTAQSKDSVNTEGPA